jgi:hypothetical protein
VRRYLSEEILGARRYSSEEILEQRIQVRNIQRDIKIGFKYVQETFINPTGCG